LGDRFVGQLAWRPGGDGAREPCRGEAGEVDDLHDLLGGEGRGGTRARGGGQGGGDGPFQGGAVVVGDGEMPFGGDPAGAPLAGGARGAT